MKRFVAFLLILVLSFAGLPVASVNIAAETSMGDINGNGDIDSMDYVLLKRAYFGTYKLEDIAIGDINGSGKIDSMDYVYLRRAYFGTYIIIGPDEENPESSAPDDSSVPESSEPDVTSSEPESSEPDVTSSEPESSEPDPTPSIPSGTAVELAYGMTYTADGLYSDADSYPYPDENGKSLTDGAVAAKDAIYSDVAFAGFNINTDYFQQNGYVSITVDLGSLCYINKMAAFVSSANEENTAAGVGVPTSVEFYVSADKSAWTKAGEAVPAENSTDTNATLALDTAVSGRYIQYRFKNSSSWIMISEVKAYGISTDPDAVPERTETVLFDSSNLTNYASAFLPNYAPFALYDTSLFSDTVVTEISFPFHSFAEGYSASSTGLYMPVYIIKTDLTTQKEDCTVENGKKIILDFTGKLNGVKQGDWITASGLNIEVGANETLAFGDTDMVVLPAFLRDNATHGFWNRVFTTQSTNNHSLIFKIKGYKNRTSSVPSLDDGINAISFIGDSISTYTNWSNNTTYNSTIGGNAVWYPNTSYTGADLSVENTWWHKTASALGYQICVNNSWSGSVVTTATTYNVRAKNIHNTTTNIAPDVVVIFMGINDCAAGTAIGSYDGKGTPSANPTTFSEAYGRMIKNIQDTYDGIEIYCCTVLPDEKRTASDNENEYNAAIRTIATNMGATVIDLYANTGITSSNVSSYTVDKLHPNSAGMQLISDVVVNAIKAQLK